MLGVDALDRQHVDGTVLADRLAGATADALFHIVLVEAAVAIGGLAVERILDADRVAEDVFPRGKGREQIAYAHRSISGG